MSDVVLVHGTTQTARAFDRLVGALARQGHRALTVDVPSGLSAQSGEYADLLAAQLPTDLHRPVVLGHSGAGLLLPALAERLDAAHQVYVAAAVADFAGGRSFLEEVGDDQTPVFTPEWVGVDPTADRAVATYFLFHDCDLAGLREALTSVGPCDLSAVLAETPVIDPAARPATYVLPAHDRTLSGAWMQRAARDRLGVEPRGLAGGHSLFFASAEAVAKVVDQACHATR